MKDVEWNDKDAQASLAAAIRKRLVTIATRYMRNLHALFRGPKTGIIYGAERVVNFIAAVDDGSGAFPFRTVEFTANKGKALGGKGRKGHKVHQASAPGEAPAIDTGALAKSVTYQITETAKDGMALDIGVSIQSGRAKIAEWLELGTTEIAPRPAWRPAMAMIEAENEAVFEAPKPLILEG